MKTLLTVICLMLWGYASFAQNVQLDYDACGNRILRKPSIGLPVTLISFTAEKLVSAAADDKEDAMALLSWQTSEEVNADRFGIESSQNGKKWVEIGSIQAKGTSTSDNEMSNTDYSFVDKAPAEGENLYRLKMIDTDESFAYSQMRNLYFESNILAYPNPVSSLLTLKWSDLRTVQVFSNSGKMIFETSNEACTIDVSKLSAGAYIFKLIGNDGSIVIRKIVKE